MHPGRLQRLLWAQASSRSFLPHGTELDGKRSSYVPGTQVSYKPCVSVFLPPLCGQGPLCSKAQSSPNTSSPKFNLIHSLKIHGWPVRCLHWAQGDQNTVVPFSALMAVPALRASLSPLPGTEQMMYRTSLAWTLPATGISEL